MIPCYACDLCSRRYNMVNPIGNRSAKIVFISDYPRTSEDKKGIGYVNQINKQLLAELSKVGITPKNAYFTHLLKCRPIKDIENYKDQEFNFHTCSKLHLYGEITSDMRLIIPIGEFVTKYLFSDSELNFKSVVNTNVPVSRKIIHPIYHPAYRLDKEDIHLIAASYKRNVDFKHKLP